ncbi:Non-specific lipid-transfer protein 2 [Cardamine amara subsp. amara]|uniref:Non-specific lipid-transfer protein n=1 Tax=Cardamine amara subsp. amara TaxID=228776 RepID=A0ABD1BYN3_CARAN
MDGLMKLSYLIFACMIVAGPITSNAALACTTVKVILKPCFPYLTQRAPLTSRCCNGVRNLNGRALTTLDRRQVCRCIKSAAKNAGPRLDTTRAAGIPRACGVNIPRSYKISTSTNCNTLR